MPVVAVLPFYRIGATPLALEIMRIFNAGSSVYASVYTDAAGTIPMGNSDTVPIQADGNGLFPVVFVPVDAAYDIKFYSPELDPRDTYEGIKPAGGGGTPGVDHYTVMVDGTDSAAGYLLDKLLNSQGIKWTVVNNGGYLQLKPVIQAGEILDGKVKVDAGDGVPGYLQDKIIEGHYISVTKVGNQLEIAFSGPEYVPKTGGNYTGDVTFEDLLLAPGGAVLYNTLIEGMLQVSGPTMLHELFAGDTVIQGTFALPAIPGTGSWLTIDVAGNVSRANLPDDDHKVLASATDSVPGFLGVKLQPGSGMRIDYTNDPDLGEIMSISMINIPTPITIPAKRIVLGSGTGVTSYAYLTYYNKQLIADAVSIETFYLGAGSYAGFSNAEVRTVPTRNFKDGITQYANGDLRIGADGDAAALMLTAATKVMTTGNDTTLRVSGKLQPPGNEIMNAAFTLPFVGAGETETFRFNGSEGTTITADAAQVPRYRSSTTGLSVVGTAGGQVDAAAVFGVAAGCKVAAITIVGISATACQVIY